MRNSTKIKSEQRDYWHRHLESYKECGDSILKYCEREKINHHSFQYWSKKFRKETSEEKSLGGQAQMDGQQKVSPFVRVISKKLITPKTDLNLELAASSVLARLSLTSGITMDCYQWPSPEWLKGISRKEVSHD